MNRPAVDRLGDCLLLSGPAIADLYWLVSVGIRAVERNGHPIRPDAYRLQQVLRSCRDDASAARHDDVAEPADVALSAENFIGTAEAALILGRSRRQVQRIATSLGGRIINGGWQFDANAVEAYQADADERRKHGRADEYANRRAG
ncbi:hypothetical protein [Rhodococcoides fascians]|uniref:hypothetical protein n=1 Tax=Rhodococcoides fascians TaxID=1828 RepID=UPI00050C4426|nr:hypothetical protein [Rhodococcus fascians]AMY53425.1 hypothetical protein A3L23_02081 [Rhodococcus fascians D188]